MFDVVVIGAGLAGTIAAVVARQAGAKVAVASRSYGATALSTGAVDIAFSPALSPAQQLPRTLAEHVMDIVAHRKRHPYGILGVEQTLDGLRAGHALLVEVLAGSGLDLPPLDLEAENHIVPSSLGAAIPAAQVYQNHRGIDLHKPLDGPWGVLQCLGDATFDATRLARGWSHDAASIAGVAPVFEIMPVGVPVLPAMAMAQALDDRSRLDALIEAVSVNVRGKGLIGLVVPPWLGMARAADAQATMRAALGMPVVEALAHVPSVPGTRLQGALDRALSAQGIARIGEVVSVTGRGDRLEQVMTGDRLAVRAGAFVLASGRFIAGGVRFGERCEEALLGLPVVTDLGPMEDDSPLPVIRETPMESHPLMTAGVAINAVGQPLREGRIAYLNLFAAGMVIGGFASRFALCADGVALATGWFAGRGALKA